MYISNIVASIVHCNVFIYLQIFIIHDIQISSLKSLIQYSYLINKQRMSSSSHQRNHSNGQSENSFRVKFQQIKQDQRQCNKRSMVKKPSINLKLLQKSHQYSSSSQLSNPQEHPMSIANSTSNQHLRRKPTSQQLKKAQISNFIIKTYRILQDKTNSQIIHWTDEGNSFIVKNKQRFQNQILPKYFKHKKFSSFVRQLNMYDFHKIRKEKEIPIFKHRYFRQGCVDMLSKIRRKSGDEVMGQDDEDGQVGGNVSFCDTKNYIPSLFDVGEKPAMSAMSFRSRSVIPYPSMLIASQPSISMMPVASGSMQSSQLDLLIQQNTQLNSCIAQLTREHATLQLQVDKKREKLSKILNILLSCDLNEQQQQVHQQIGINAGRFDACTLRDLQGHVLSQEESYVFCDYLQCIRTIYNGLKANIININNREQRQQQQTPQ